MSTFWVMNFHIAYTAPTEALLLGLLTLWSVLVHQLEQLGGGLPVQSAVELVDNWGNLLSLETDVFGPFDES